MNHFLEGDFTFQYWSLFFRWGASFLSGGGGAPWGISFNEGGRGFEKNRRMGRGRHPMSPLTMGNQGTPVLGSLLNDVAALQACNFIE